MTEARDGYEKSRERARRAIDRAMAEHGLENERLRGVAVRRAFDSFDLITLTEMLTDGDDVPRSERRLPGVTLTEAAELLHRPVESAALLLDEAVRSGMLVRVESGPGPALYARLASVTR